MSKTKNRNPRDGSRLDDFLKKDGIFKEVVSRAEKEILACKIERCSRL